MLTRGHDSLSVYGIGKQRSVDEWRCVARALLHQGLINETQDGYPVLSLEGERIGEITSGSPAPFLKKNIALAYVPVAYTELGTEVGVEIRGQSVKAKVVPTPFYKRPKPQQSVAELHVPVS